MSYRHRIDVNPCLSCSRRSSYAHVQNLSTRVSQKLTSHGFYIISFSGGQSKCHFESCPFSGEVEVVGPCTPISQASFTPISGIVIKYSLVFWPDALEAALHEVVTSL